jgi:hypothetical protein
MLSFSFKEVIYGIVVTAIGNNHSMCMAISGAAMAP